MLRHISDYLVDLVCGEEVKRFNLFAIQVGENVGGHVAGRLPIVQARQSCLKLQENVNRLFWTSYDFLDSTKAEDLLDVPAKK